MTAPSISTPSVRTPTGSSPLAGSTPLPQGAGGLLAAPAAGGGLPGTTTAFAAGGGALLGAAPAASPIAGGGRALTSRATRRALANGVLSQAQLERTVARLQRCLGQLTDQQRRVLTLRAGLGPRPALSRVQVARRLDLGVAQTRRIERRALRRLGALDGAGMCSAAAAASPLAFLTGGPMGALAPVGSVLGVALAGDSSRDRLGVKGVAEAGGNGDDHGGLALPPPIGDGADWTLLISLGLLGALLLLVRRELLRR